jgi:ribulose 1,5-bisphosphate synthetase/thiazole synthase
MITNQYVYPLSLSQHIISSLLLSCKYALLISYFSDQYMQGKSVAILGAGISGLSFALKASSIPQLRYKIFEKSQRPGGRVFSPNVSNNLEADLGANIIDF